MSGGVENGVLSGDFWVCRENAQEGALSAHHGSAQGRRIRGEPKHWLHLHWPAYSLQPPCSWIVPSRRGYAGRGPKEGPRGESGARPLRRSAGGMEASGCQDPRLTLSSRPFQFDLQRIVIYCDSRHAELETCCDIPLGPVSKLLHAEETGPWPPEGQRCPGSRNEHSGVRGCPPSECGLRGAQGPSRARAPFPGHPGCGLGVTQVPLGGCCGPGLSRHQQAAG